ncbi:MAG: hypothetical protein Q8N63_08085 [Nanoarchaeota archaeon]|nr:hypothetical protein [Nanoarchaeota archaeon]
MASLEQLQILAQLVDSMEIAIDKLEKSYQNNDSENFQKSKKTISDFQQKILEIIKGNQI